MLPQSRVLEKSGLQFQGHEKYEGFDVVSYVISADNNNPG